VTPWLNPHALAAMILLIPTAAGAETDRIRKALANSELTASERMVRLAGPDWTRRVPREMAPRARHMWRYRGQANKSSDPVKNGVRLGAIIGAAGGAGLTGLMATQCDGKCDDPSLSTVLLSTVAVGAGVGALIGFMIDRSR
jgi:hypothetical protein